MIRKLVHLSHSAIDKVGREGLISLEEGKSTVTELEITEGMGFDRGFISGYFVTNTGTNGSCSRKSLCFIDR